MPIAHTDITMMINMCFIVQGVQAYGIISLHDSPRPLFHSGRRLAGSRWPARWTPRRTSHPERGPRRSGRAAQCSPPRWSPCWWASWWVWWVLHRSQRRYGNAIIKTLQLPSPAQKKPSNRAQKPKHHYTKSFDRLKKKNHWIYQSLFPPEASTHQRPPFVQERSL